MRPLLTFLTALVLQLGWSLSCAQTPQDTAFTYQGQLEQNNLPVTASVDMVFTLYDAAASGNVVGTPLALTATNGDPVSVVDGLFTVSLDFGAASFLTTLDDARWLAVTVNGSPLSPRTKIENSPYALTSLMAYSVPAGSIGTLQINAAQVQRRVAGSCASGSSISLINQDGSVSCQAAGAGTITGVSPTSGSGLTGGGSSGSVSLGTDLSVLQKRVSGTCASGSSISSVNGDGTVGCHAGGSGTVTSVAAGSGLTGGTITTTGTLAVDTGVVALVANTWNLNGNTGVGAGFVGTTDNTALLFKVNGLQVGALQPTQNPAAGYVDTPNVIFGSSTNSVGSNVVGATISGGGGSYCSPAPCTPTTFQNTVNANWGTIAGGAGNTAGGGGAFIGGGNANKANGLYSAVAGGQINSADGYYAAVPGGTSNAAGGIWSFAAGTGAHVRNSTEAGVTGGDAGTFVWSDETGNSTPFVSSGIDQFLVRASGGMAINGTPFYSNAELTIRGSGTAGSGDNSADILLIPRGATAGYDLVADANGHFDIYTATSGSVGYGLTLDNVGNLTVNAGNLTLAGAAAQAYKPGGGSWAAPSDARLKSNVEPLEHSLDKLLQLRGVTFDYAQPDSGLHPPGRHTGFIAQEVQEVFPAWVGQTPDGYLTVGPQGFEAMTVEALREVRAEKDEELAALKAEKDAEIADLRARLDALAARIDQLRSGQVRP